MEESSILYENEQYIADETDNLLAALSSSDPNFLQNDHSNTTAVHDSNTATQDDTAGTSFQNSEQTRRPQHDQRNLMHDARSFDQNTNAMNNFSNDSRSKGSSFEEYDMLQDHTSASLPFVTENSGSRRSDPSNNEHHASTNTNNHPQSLLHATQPIRTQHEVAGKKMMLKHAPESGREEPYTPLDHDVPLHMQQKMPHVEKSSSNTVTPKAASMNGVIEILDDDDDDDIQIQENHDVAVKRQRVSSNPPTASYINRYTHTPEWMHQNRPNYLKDSSNGNDEGRRPPNFTFPRQGEPNYLTLPDSFVSTWQQLMPRLTHTGRQRKSFELSLLNVREFTITGVPTMLDGPPTPIIGLRTHIKKISKNYGKAVFERDSETGGRWKIPLGAYHAFHAYLQSDPMCQVTGIPEGQLKIASLGKARMEKGYPSAKKLISEGVPKGLAATLAPFQRGGVDFVIEKGGRALIADDMGLGKTIQAIASVSVYHEEWPVLVLTPSSARYHWEREFLHWLGKNSAINKQKELKETNPLNQDSDDGSLENGSCDKSICMRLLEESQVHVLTTSKQDVLPNDSTRVVICSYGLAPSLIEAGKIKPRDFRCAVVDESHMLKNMSTKRTSTLVPVLHATNRCLLLSGTPALARPAELWPQLKILGTEADKWWQSEDEFVSKYVKNISAARRAELHTLLIGTVMIRRLKTDILKSLPQKVREKAVVDVSTDALRREFHQCMMVLRKGNGVMGKLARTHSALGEPEPPSAETITEASNDGNNELAKSVASLQQEYDNRYEKRKRALLHGFETTSTELDDTQKQDLLTQLDWDIRRELDVWYKERLSNLQNNVETDSTQTRASVLNRLYLLTAKAKIPLVVDMVKKWVADPTKGKLCVFAHHISVLDALVDQGGLSNVPGSKKKYIRIDGSTSPKERQSQIESFQSDPSVRIAVLGLTAAGVAVTLTASSTVWFTELFWTPALMIQAEDRCHRIGQNSSVQCVYFVAVGTIDELLWKLLENKFRDLGEFVEGKEKLKLVVNRTYHGINEVYSIFGSTPEGSIDDQGDNDGLESDEKDIFDFDLDLEQDIAQLSKDELIMVLPDADEDDIDSDSKREVEVVEPSVSQGTLGRSEEEAILLSGDEEESDVDKPISQANIEERNRGKSFFGTNGRFSKSRIYTILFFGPTYGMMLNIFQRRPVVKEKVDGTEKLKPSVGDILVAMNGLPLPLTDNLHQILQHLRLAIQKPPVQLTFAEVPEFSAFLYQARLAAQERMRIAASASSGNSREVIDLLDDE